MLLRGLICLPKSNIKSSSIGLKIDDKVSFDGRTISEIFTSFYTTVASRLVQKWPKRVNQFGKQFVEFFYRIKGVKPNKYSFFIVSENNILKYLSRLGAKKATGLDGIPARFVHHCLSVETC